MAKRLSRPILKTVDVTKHIADGNYKIRIDDSAYIVVRGLEYFTITRKDSNVLKDIKTEVKYKRDAKIFLECKITQTGG